MRSGRAGTSRGWSPFSASRSPPRCRASPEAAPGALHPNGVITVMRCARILEPRMSDPPPQAASVSLELGDEGAADLAAPAAETAATADRPSAPGRRAKARDDATRWLMDLRGRSPLVAAAMEAGDLDRRRAGSLLAGGIAFRLFLWLLPASLFVAALSGLVHPVGSASPEHVARSLGLAASVATTVDEATRQSDK